MLVMSKEDRERQKFERDYRANARALRSLRARGRMNLKALAKKSGVNYTTISRIENGHNRSPHWSTLEQLAEALGVEVEQLVIFDEDLLSNPGQENGTPRYPGGAETERDFEQGLDYDQELQSEGENGKEEGGEASEGRQT